MARAMCHAIALRMNSGAIFWTASGRNKQPILEVLRAYAPNKLRPGQSRPFFLEVGSGHGEHVGHFLRHSLGNTPSIWQPSDCDDTYFQSIEAHCRSAFEEQKTDSIALRPILLDVRADKWTVHHSASGYWGRPNPLFSNADEVTREAHLMQELYSETTSGLFVGISKK